MCEHFAGETSPPDFVVIEGFPEARSAANSNLAGNRASPDLDHQRQLRQQVARRHADHSDCSRRQAA
jgi:hypothetical protein